MSTIISMVKIGSPNKPAKEHKHHNLRLKTVQDKFYLNLATFTRQCAYEWYKLDKK